MTFLKPYFFFSDTDCPEACPAVYNPVCGTNGIKYDNLCQLKYANCLDEDGEINHDLNGACLVDSEEEWIL